jgi:preprotein translocase subunit SecA
LNEALIYSALDEPLFKHFGGDKIIQMMKQLGMKEDSMIEHKMVSKAIENAQEKIEKKVIAEQDASSPQKWIERNL